MAYTARDRSEDDAAPILFYRISSFSFTQVFKYTNAETNQERIPGDTYISCEGISSTDFDTVSLLDSTLTVDLRLPADDPLAQLCCFAKLPKDVFLTIWRKHREDNEVKVEWIGSMIGAGAKAGEAWITTGSIIQSKLNGNLFLPTTQRKCNNELYDPRCGADRVSFTHTVTVVQIKQRYVEITSSSFPMGSLMRGLVKNNRTNEEHPILWHTDGIVGAEMIGVGYPFVDIQVGDTLAVSRGCNYLREGDCLNVFGRVAGGYNGMDLTPIGDVLAKLNIETITTTSTTTTTTTEGEAAKTPSDDGFPWDGGINAYTE